ncbi:MAG: DUF2330 domain-containing protein [Fimbriiglobus sp.]
MMSLVWFSRFFISCGWIVGLLLAAGLLTTPQRKAEACCPAYPPNQPVVNADQSVILIWDAATKTQHFIRKASFQGLSANVGFIVPSPSLPALSESGAAAFDTLAEITAPRKVRKAAPVGCGGPERGAKSASADRDVIVHEIKNVAGFDAAVLEAKTATGLVDWLSKNGYEYNDAIKNWAKPYVEGRWFFTALKVSKGEMTGKTRVTADSLRLSFTTDKPVFPYREPDYTKSNAEVGARSRMLRIFFISDKRYTASYQNGTPWPATIPWTGPVSASQRTELTKTLQIEDSPGPSQWWLTEFEDNWSYNLASSDVYFEESADQTTRERPPHITYVDPSGLRVGAFCIATGLGPIVVSYVIIKLVRRSRKRRNR